MKVNTNNSVNSVPVLEVILYLASLVSRPETVDPILNKLRVITSRLDAGEAPSPESEAEMQGIRSELETYLIHEEKVRSFTKETLDQKVADNFDMQKPRTRHLRTRFIVSLALGFIALLWPFIFLWNQPLSTRLLLAMPGFLIAMNVGIIWFYLSALKDFTPQLKSAYIFICLGLFTTGVNGLQLPLMYTLDLVDSPWFRYGAFMPPFPLACFFMYVGIRKYAVALGIKHWIMSWPLMIGLSLVSVIVAVFIPRHVAFPDELAFFNLSAVSCALTLLYLIGVAVITYTVRARVTARYEEALRFFFWMAVILAATTLEYTIVMFATGQLNGITQMIAMLPFIGSEYCKLRSGYIFKKNSGN